MVLCDLGKSQRYKTYLMKNLLLKLATDNRTVTVKIWPSTMAD